MEKYFICELWYVHICVYTYTCKLWLNVFPWKVRNRNMYIYCIMYVRI